MRWIAAFVPCIPAAGLVAGDKERNGIRRNPVLTLQDGEISSSPSFHWSGCGRVS